MRPHPVSPLSKLRAALAEQDELVNVANAAARSQFLFHEMVEAVEVDICQELDAFNGSTARRSNTMSATCGIQGAVLAPLQGATYERTANPWLKPWALLSWPFRPVQTSRFCPHFAWYHHAETSPWRANVHFQANPDQ